MLISIINFKKIKKNIIFIYLKKKSTLETNYYHNIKPFLIVTASMLLFTHMGAYETGSFTNDTIIDQERVQKT